MDIVRRTPSIAWHSTLHGEALISVLIFLVLLFNPIAGERAPHWLAEHSGWGWIALAIIFTHLLMKAVYEKYKEKAEQTDELLTECEKFKQAIDDRKPHLDGEIQKVNLRR